VKKKEDEQKFLQARSGDALLFPFQCDTCWFRNLTKRLPQEGSLADGQLLRYIRRVNLDGMWSRSPSTVANVKYNFIRIMKLNLELGLENNFPEMGPWPVADHVGFQLAITQLKFSQRTGNNELTHLQFDTVRKLRTAFNHIHEVSAQAHESSNFSFRDMSGKAYINSGCPTQCRLYLKFVGGMLARMGRQTKPNIALDYKILHLILQMFESEIRSPAVSMERKRWLVCCGTLLLLGFVLSLRGPECFMVEAHGLLSHLHYGTEEEEATSFVVVPLLGKFKNEDGERWHLMLSVSTTSSGFEVRKWIEAWTDILIAENNVSGPAFCYPDGKMMKSLDVDLEFHEALEKVQTEHPQLIEQGLDIRENFSIFRSLRRGSTSRATELKLDDTVVNLHNRWRTVDYLGGQRSSRSMRDYYTSIRLTRAARLEYTSRL